MNNIEFELYGDTPEIIVPVKVEILGQSKPVNFKAAWERLDPESARELWQTLADQEQELEGAALVNYQQELIRERLLRIENMPVKGGKKISAGGENSEHDLEAVRDRLLELTPYHNALYQSMVGSLFEKDINLAKAKN